MGTSSIYDGPVKSLLPDDYENTDIDDEPQPEDDSDDHENIDPTDKPYRWKDAKTRMTGYVKGKITSQGRVMNGYLRAGGGSRRLAQQSFSGKSGAIGIGKVIQDFKNDGVKKTLERLQIECVGREVKFVLSELVNVIAGKSNTKEDVVARGAAIEAITIMYQFVEENGRDIDALQSIDESTFRNILEVFMSEYIFKRMMNDLQSSFEKYENNPKEALNKEQELKEYIKVKVELKIKELKPENLDYNTKSINREINNLFIKCFNTFEDYL